MKVLIFTNIFITALFLYKYVSVCICNKIFVTSNVARMSERGRGQGRDIRRDDRGNVRGRATGNRQRGNRNVTPMQPGVELPQEVVFSQNYEEDEYIKVVYCKEIRPKWQIIKFDGGPRKASRCPLFEKFGAKNFMILEFPKACPPDIVKSVVKTGLLVKVGDSLDKKLYTFFGHSPTQLREGKCVLYNSAELGVFEDLIAQFGEFDMKNVGKRAARIGLLLSAAVPIIDLDERQITVDRDIERGGYSFTDGCGRISPSVAWLLSDELNKQYSTRIRFYSCKDLSCPSVFQVRIMGCKGTLILDPQLEDGIAIRESMRKVIWKPTGERTPLRIVDEGKGVSFPNRFGSLNTQYIRLLSALGVRDEVFLEMQKRSFEELNRIEYDEDVQVRYLCIYERFDDAEEIIRTRKIGEEALKFLKRRRMTCMMQEQTVKDKLIPAKINLRLPLEQSRTLYGVADPTKKLNYGTCFLCVTIRGKPKVLEGHRVVVTKSPCYHPGDIRVLTVVNLPECSHLVDCIVFPVNGIYNI